jgi:hypothetical protein
MPATTYTASAYFLGTYRPVYVTGETPTQALARLAERIADAPDALRDRLQSVWDMTTHNGWGHCTATTSEYGTYGVSWREGLTWEPLAAIVADMPECPGVRY